MGTIWSDAHKYETWLTVEIAVCEVLAEMGHIPRNSLKNIQAKSAFDEARILEIEATTRHDVIAFLTNVAEYVGPDARFIHMGMTSSDLLDTALALLCLEAGKHIETRLENFQQVLRDKAQEYKYTWQIGRTHGIHAEPITFGMKLALWSEEMGRHLRRWGAALSDIAVGKISGAVGTYAHLSPEVEEQVCARLGLEPASVSNQIIQRDRHAHYLATMAIAGATLEKIAVEIRHLQRTEVGEAEEPFRRGQKGSSSMPHKRNPIIAERISGMARLLRANTLAGLENVALWHERDISHSSVERIIIPDTTSTLDYMLLKMTELMEGLVVYPETMMENLNRTGGLIFSQPVLLALIEKGATRDEAYVLVQRHAMQVWEAGGDFQSLLKTDPDIRDRLNEDELKACFDYDNLRERIDTIYERLGLEKG
jgi:adenylosuccinate lyase